MSDFLDLGIERNLIDNGTSDDYYTPPFIFKALGVTFDLDVCAPPGGVPWIPALRHYDLLADGLTSPWEGRVWMNPPYSNPGPWLKKLSIHNHGFTLVPMSKSQWFIELWNQANGMIVLPPNLKFVRASGETAPIFMPCVLAAFGQSNVDALRNSGLGKVR